jgi:hypothetical protein
MILASFIDLVIRSIAVVGLGMMVFQYSPAGDCFFRYLIFICAWLSFNGVAMRQLQHTAENEAL